VFEFNDLGVIVDNKITWSTHIKSIKARAMRNLGYIKRVLGNNVSLDAKRMLYISLVRSVVMYASQVWSPYLKRDLAMLESIQRQATMYMVKYTDIDYIGRLDATNLLPLAYIREINDILLFYSMMYDRTSINLGRYFTFNDDVRRGRSKVNNYNIVLSRFNTRHCSHGFTNRVIHLWDSLTPALKQIEPSGDTSTEMTMFKRNLIMHYSSKLKNNFDVEDICTWVSWCDCPSCRV
jgi:hypothetical protein